MLLHANATKRITDDLDLVQVARNFVDANNANDAHKNISDQPIILCHNINNFVFNIHSPIHHKCSLTERKTALSDYSLLLLVQHTIYLHSVE